LVRVNELVEEPYSSVLGYPKCPKDELESRVRELESIGVKGIIFEGSSMIGKLNLLGKGCVSIVVKAVLDDKTVALKIRRLDADRESMEREAGFLKIANRVDVGPQLFAKSKNFLAIGLADGMKMIDWIKQDLDARQVRYIALRILEQCFKLDTIGLDHGELSNMNKHVIVGKDITIIDFESASTKRRVSNVTAAAQCIFIGSEIARKVKSVLKMDSTDEIIQALKKYKHDVSKENLESLFDLLKLR
jgi:putative serine/threonine protein kinase